MSSNNLVIIVKSPNDRVPAHSIVCLPSWTVYEVKEYISRHYATHPPPALQRLIHSGRLLKDDVPIQALFKDSSERQTVHLVCRGSEVSFVQKEPEDVDDISKIPPNELQQYQQAYYQYLNDFFMRNSQDSTVTPPSIVHPMVGNFMAAGLTSYPYANLQTPVAQPTVAGGAPNQSNPQSVAQQQPVTPAPPQEHQQQQQQPNNQPVMMVAGAAGMGGADEFAADGGNVDIVDRFYMLFRLSLFLGLCFAYSSLDKAIIVFSVAAYVYFYNIYRQYVANRPANRAAVRPAVPDAAAANGSDNQQQPLPAAENGDQQVNRRALASESNAETNAPVNAPVAPVQTNRLTSSLRLFASTSFQFFSSLVASLIPEQPPPMAFD